MRPRQQKIKTKNRPTDLCCIEASQQKSVFRNEISAARYSLGEAVSPRARRSPKSSPVLTESKRVYLQQSSMRENFFRKQATEQASLGRSVGQRAGNRVCPRPSSQCPAAPKAFLTRDMMHSLEA